MVHHLLNYMFNVFATFCASQLGNNFPFPGFNTRRFVQRFCMKRLRLKHAGDADRREKLHSNPFGFQTLSSSTIAGGAEDKLSLRLYFASASTVFGLFRHVVHSTRPSMLLRTLGYTHI
jgi:hypothetical protein